jgi:hypothetical protein
MLVAGIRVSASAVAELALRLHRVGEIGLANYFGHAVDHVHDELSLTPHDYPLILAVLGDDTPPKLAELRRHLQRGERSQGSRWLREAQPGLRDERPNSGRGPPSSERVSEAAARP